jgi:photosystem II stability/assembly factor-like uncharacterized protein
MRPFQQPAVLLVALGILGSVPTAGFAGEAPAGFAAETFAGLEFRGIGPALMSGRIADVAIDPARTSTWYVAVGSGGVWKTVNRGTTWTPVFDTQSSYSIGVVAIDPHDPDAVWVGTGENVSGRHVGYGDGVYKSLDGGRSWTNVGLEQSEHIGMIAFDPTEPGVVYVAAQGPLWSGGGERGLYKTTNGGETWERILSAGPYTGVNEVHLDPRDPDVIYAVTHQRLRNVAAVINGGPESGIHKSTDGGVTWRELTEGLPEGAKGKIGLAISPQDPDVIYATIELERRQGGFWRSDDGGENWEKRNELVSGGTGPHYYQEIFASPHAFDRVYQLEVYMHVTEDGGKTFGKVNQESRHVDHHALAFDPDDPDYLLVGTDGGLYESHDLGATWRFFANLPVTQFYKVAVDNDEPFYNVYGGTQDNNTQGGPSRTLNNSGIRNSDWFVTIFGDGHQPATDYSNPDIVYSQMQQGVLYRYDRKTGESVFIQPQPAAGEPSERFNWDAPILVSAHDPARLYHASQRVWRSDDRGDSWRPISGDLSRGQDRLTLPVMDRVWSFDAPWDLLAMSKFGTITSLAESPLDERLLYAGTDDGRLHVSEDGGESWREIGDLPGVPENYFVNDLKADLHDVDTVYVAVDDHKSGDFSPYLLRSTDRGRSWSSIAGNLPERHLVWRLVQDHVEPGLLFVATEFGVFFSVDGGGDWVELTGGLPTISFRDLAIQRRDNDLVGASFGRGFYILDDYSPLRGLAPDDLRQKALLFPVRAAPWYVERQPLAGTPRGFQGDGFFVAPNPPFGATFTYYLRDELKSAKQRRRDREEPIEDRGGDTPYPGWDALRAEAREDGPAIVLTVRNENGRIIRRIEGPVEAGFHRVAWDLRYPTVEPWQPPATEAMPWAIPKGALAPPGTYTVTLARRVDGELHALGVPRRFEVISIREPTLPGASPEAATEFTLRAYELQRANDGAVAAIDELLVQLAAAKEALMRSTADASLYERADAMERQAEDLRERLAGWKARDDMGDPGPMSVKARLSVATRDKTRSAYGPTPTQAESLAIAESGFAQAYESLVELVDVDYRRLQRDLEAAGVPWSPGRGAPDRPAD